MMMMMSLTHVIVSVFLCVLLKSQQGDSESSAFPKVLSFLRFVATDG